MDPAYYEKMSRLLEALIAQRRKGALGYQEYLARIVELTKQARYPDGASDYPTAMNTPAKRALYNNLGRNPALALAVDQAVQNNRMDGWRNHPMKIRKIKLAIKEVIDQALRGGVSGDIQDDRGNYQKGSETVDELTDRILELVKNQNAY